MSIITTLTGWRRNPLSLPRIQRLHIEWQIPVTKTHPSRIHFPSSKNLRICPKIIRSLDGTKPNRGIESRRHWKDAKGSVKDIGEEDRAFDDCFRPATTNVAGGLHEAVRGQSRNKSRSWCKRGKKLLPLGRKGVFVDAYINRPSIGFAYESVSK